jgi:hypothetical protein
MTSDNSRMLREKKTIRVMISMYCTEKHDKRNGMCGECQELHDYAMERLDKCRFGDEKPTCENCPVHCYEPSMRAKVKEVMRYSGPRMLFRHPVLAIRHMIDGRVKVRDK